MYNYIAFIYVSMIKESGTDEESQENYQKEIFRYVMATVFQIDQIFYEQI